MKRRGLVVVVGVFLLTSGIAGTVGPQVLPAQRVDPGSTPVIATGGDLERVERSDTAHRPESDAVDGVRNLSGILAPDVLGSRGDGVDANRTGRSASTDGNGTASTATGLRGFASLIGPPDTDGDGIHDRRERDLGTDPALGDSDGDGIGDARELERGTDPTAADTDGDGLDDGHERAVGTDPTVSDTDGDTLGDGAEYYDRTPAGAPLPGSDPLAADIYAQVDYAQGTADHDGRFYRLVERAFARMPVDNPDNTTGIDLHLREGGTLNGSVTYTGANFWRLRQRLYADRLGPRTDVYHLVVVGEVAESGAGYGAVGGDFAIVDRELGNVSQRNVIVHELLHNVVGRIDAAGACPNDPAHYCADGWLQHHVSHPEDEFLPTPIARELERDGFAD